MRWRHGHRVRVLQVQRHRCASDDVGCARGAFEDWSDLNRVADHVGLHHDRRTRVGVLGRVGGAEVHQAVAEDHVVISAARWRDAGKGVLPHLAGRRVEDGQVRVRVLILQRPYLVRGGVHLQTVVVPGHGEAVLLRAILRIGDDHVRLAVGAGRVVAVSISDEDQAVAHVDRVGRGILPLHSGSKDADGIALLGLRHSGGLRAGGHGQGTESKSC